MRVRLLVAAAAAALVVGMIPSPAGAQVVATDTSAPTVTASITGTLGTRVLSSIGAISMSSVQGSATLTSAPFVVAVTEAARSGTVGWLVTAEMTTALTSLSPVASIANSALTLTQSAMTQTPGAPATGTDTAGSSPVGNLGAPVTVWTNAGQVTTTTYTGLHSNSPTITLRPPNGTVNSTAYIGTLTVTLFQ